MKKRRGAGNRGGRGMAGTGRKADVKKPSIWKNKKYFGVHGFKKKNIKLKINPINLITLEEKTDKLLIQEKNKSTTQAGKNITSAKENKSGNAFGRDKNITGQGPVQAVVAVNTSLSKGNPSNKSIESRVNVLEKLQEKISAEEIRVKNETNNNRDKTKEFKNQNVVRERVMSLLALKNATGDKGIGQQISEIAIHLSNSINKTQKAEEKIMDRGGLERFFFGGDEQAAAEIEQQVEQNRARISQLKELRKSTGLEINLFIEEQIQELELEQNRLSGLAQREKESKGIFGWLFK
ncbi:MAG: hypothetical protein KKD39_00860, partial [Candidatus Altiarchaeota archaeon]|nr:hypothetical protein [Candidatus Altiarchaeota archaeon]